MGGGGVKPKFLVKLGERVYRKAIGGTIGKVSEFWSLYAFCTPNSLVKVGAKIGIRIFSEF